MDDSFTSGPTRHTSVGTDKRIGSHGDLVRPSRPRTIADDETVPHQRYTQRASRCAHTAQLGPAGSPASVNRAGQHVERFPDAIVSECSCYPEPGCFWYIRSE